MLFTEFIVNHKHFMPLGGIIGTVIASTVFSEFLQSVLFKSAHMHIPTCRYSSHYQLPFPSPFRSPLTPRSASFE